MLKRNDMYKAMAVVLSFTALTTGCGKGSSQNPKIDGIDGPNVSFVDNKFVMTVVFKNINFDQGGRIPIPKMPNSYVEFGPDFQSNGFLLSTGLDIADIRTLTGNAFNTLDPLTLPGGRPLPGVADGYLPGLAIQVPKLDNIVFYVGSNVFGAFVPVNIPIDNYIVSHRFYDAAGDRVGTISVVGRDSAKANSGFLLLIDLKGKVQKILSTGHL